MMRRNYGFIKGDVGRNLARFIYVYCNEDDTVAHGSERFDAESQAREEFYKRFPDGVILSEDGVKEIIESNRLRQVMASIKRTEEREIALDFLNYHCTGIFNQIWPEGVKKENINVYW